MKTVIYRLLHWNDDFLFDSFSAALEAFIVLAISSISLIILSIKYGLDTTGIQLPQAISTTFRSSFQPTEMITYVTGVLSSTIAYYVVRIASLRRYIVRALFIIVVPFLIVFFATPLFMSGIDSAPANPEFAVSLARLLGFFAFAIWLFALFSQRRIFKTKITLNSDRRAHEIARNVEKTP